MQVFNSPLPPSQTQSVKTPLLPYPSLCNTCLTYRTPCHAIGHQVLPTQLFLGKPRIFFLHTLFQFGLAIAPVQNSGLINAKYNNALYGTIIIWYNK